MSRYKDQLKEILSQFEVQGESALSIGNANDDRKYFKKADFAEWMTVDYEPELKPNLIWDMNKAMVDEEVMIPEDMIEKFDYVFAFELWDYIWDPVTAHKNVYALLKQGGTYMGSYPLLYCKHNPAGTDMLRYTDDAIKKYLNICGFKDITIIPRHGNDLILDFYSRDGMRLIKDFDHTITGWVVKATK